MKLEVIHTKGLKKIKGLIGLKKIEPLYFQTRFGIHTFGVKFPIDVVILNDNETVVAIKQYFKPNRIFLWNPKYKNVLELPTKTVDKEKIKVGEKIELVFISQRISARF